MRHLLTKSAKRPTTWFMGSEECFERPIAARFAVKNVRAQNALQRLAQISAQESYSATMKFSRYMGPDCITHAYTYGSNLATSP
jgi:hypothetical protein